MYELSWFLRIGLETLRQDIYHYNRNSFAWFVSDGVLKKQDCGYAATKGIRSGALHGHEVSQGDSVWTSKFQGMFFLYYGFSFLPQKYLHMKLLQFFNVYIVLWIWTPVPVTWILGFVQSPECSSIYSPIPCCWNMQFITVFKQVQTGLHNAYWDDGVFCVRNVTYSTGM